MVQRAEWAEFQRHSAQGGTEGAQRRPRDGPTAGIGDRIASRGIYVVKVRLRHTTIPHTMDRGNPMREPSKLLKIDCV